MKVGEQLTVHDISTGEEASVRVCTGIPRRPCLRRSVASLQRAARLRNTFEIVAHSFDEDSIVSINVHWIPAVAGARDIPTFEQHFLGYDFAAARSVCSSRRSARICSGSRTPARRRS